jgi:hypothetical protein
LLFFTTRFWIKLSLFNLLIVATIGAIMRYKIGFEFPFIDQKKLQEAHSHFAFLGWVSQLLIVLMIEFLKPFLKSDFIAKFNSLIAFHVLIAYLTLISFLFQGYGILTISLSTLSVILFVLFSWMFFKGLKSVSKNHPSRHWFKAAIICNLMSSIGTFMLGYFITAKKLTQLTYLSSVYEYLHFQYNGWFFFACVGLLMAFIYNTNPSLKYSNYTFWLFAFSIIPAYGLSVLWMNLPIWLYIIVILGTIAQTLGWINLLKDIHRSNFFGINRFDLLTRIIFLILSVALSVKFLLQLGSTIPSISKLAFGFRPIVIAYLHLILLAIISVFLITYLYIHKLIHNSKLTTWGLGILMVGIYINEVMLGIQGIASIGYHAIPQINTYLFSISIIIFIGIFILFISQIFRKNIKNIPQL